MDDMYENLILPARTTRTLTKLIQDLLRLYYENDKVRRLLEDDTEYSVDIDDILQQVDGILAAEKESAAYTSILQTQVEGMNEYLEQQHSVLSSGLESGINGFADFAEETEVEPVLSIGVQDTFVSNSDISETSADTGTTEMVGLVQTLMQQVSVLSKKIDSLERKDFATTYSINGKDKLESTQATQELYNSMNTVVENSKITEDIEDISFDEDVEDISVDEEEVSVQNNVQKAHNVMRTPSKKSTESVVPATMMKLMRGMEKTN